MVSVVNSGMLHKLTTNDIDDAVEKLDKLLYAIDSCGFCSDDHLANVRRVMADIFSKEAAAAAELEGYENYTQDDNSVEPDIYMCFPDQYYSYIKNLNDKRKFLYAYTQTISYIFFEKMGEEEASKRIQAELNDMKY